MKKIFLLILSLVFTSSLFASDYYWVGSSGANWGAASNFKIGGFAGTTATVLPTVADNLFIGNGSANAIITLNISDTINDITFLGSGQIFINTSNGSALRVEGNLTASNTNTTGGGSAVILFGGSSNQSLTGSTTGINKNKLPNLTIDKSGGTLTFYNTITMGGSTKLRYVSGTLDAGTSVFVFYFANVTQGKISLYDAVFEGNNTSYKMIDTLTVTDTLKTTGSSKCELDSGVIILTGNLRIENTSGNARGGAKILLRGTANQTLSSAASVSANQGEIAGIYIQKTSGTVHIKGKITLYQWENNYSTANVYADSSTVVFDGGNSNALGGTYSTHFWDVDFSNKIGQTTIVLGTGSVSKVMHNLIISGTANFTINSNTIEVEGNLTLTNTSNSTGGSGTIKICGSANQTLTGTSSTTDCELPSLTIDKSGGTATMSAFFNVRGNFTYVAGTVDATTHSSTVFKYTGTLDGQGTSSTMNFNNVNIERQVTLGGTLNVNGALTLTNGSSFNSSNDSINLQGDLTVNDAFAFSSSVITFKGNQSQAVNGTAAQTFYKVIVNKSGNHITLSKNLTITNNLTLTAGNIISGASALVILNDNATVSSASDNSFVSGPVKKTGNDAFTFPTGKSGHYHAIGITAPSSTTDAFTAEYFSSAYSDLTKDTSLTYINNCEYWNLDRTTGSSNVKVTLYWTNNICDIYTLSTLRVSRYDAGTSKWKSITTATTSGNTTTGNIQTDNNQSTFGYFAIGKRSPAVYAHAGMNDTICSGSSAIIGASPSATFGLTPYSYSWSPSTGLNATNVANPTASPTDTIEYILTVTDLDHTVSKDTMVLVVNNNPVAHAGDNDSIPKGMTAILGDSPAATLGMAPYTYQWSPDNGLAVSNEDSLIASPLETTTYYLTVTDQNGCSNTDSVKVGISLTSYFDSTYLFDGTYIFNDTLTVKTFQLFTTYKSQFGLLLNDSMALRQTDGLDSIIPGKFYSKYVHFYKRYLVEGDQLNVSGQYDVALIVNGIVARNLNVDVSDPISENDALVSALDYIDASQYAWENDSSEVAIKRVTGNPTATYFPVGQLVITKKKNAIYNFNPSIYRLCWNFVIFDDTFRIHFLNVDALTGEIFDDYDGSFSDFQVLGSTSTYYNGTQPINTTTCTLCTNYKAFDPGENIGIVESSNAGNFVKDNDNDWQENNKVRVAGTALWAARSTYDFFLNRHGRWDGYSTRIQINDNSVTSPVYTIQSINGPFYSYRYIRIGNVNSYSHFLTYDIVAHEYSHSIAWYACHLAENGDKDALALSEGLADIFGELSEKYKLGSTDWIHGTDDASADHRNFDDPTQDDIIAFPTQGSPDWYPVNGNWTSINIVDPHMAGGVIRKWFYLLAFGGTTTHNGINYSVTGIGVDKAEDITYVMANWMLWFSVRYPEAAKTSVVVAESLFGACSAEQQAVVAAWKAVGINIKIICLHDNPWVSEYGSQVQKTSGPEGSNGVYSAIVNDAVPDMTDETFVWNYPDGWTASEEGNELIVSDFGEDTSHTVLVSIDYSYKIDDVGFTSSDTILVHFTNNAGLLRKKPENSVQSNDLTIYPNPSQGTIDLIWKSPVEDAVFELFDIEGRLLFTDKINGSSSLINLPNVISGNYIAKIISKDFTITKKIIINK